MAVFRKSKESDEIESSSNYDPTNANAQFNEVDETASEINSGSYENTWGTKLGNYASYVSNFQTKFSPEQLGQGQFMSVEKSAQIIAASNARNALVTLLMLPLMPI
ncbi:MAG: hypothetical protein HC908_01595 [Calothrix sp. SM1_7_51]|nr:hypothetical protein [Calothrix sp. SM1_7_51]